MASKSIASKHKEKTYRRDKAAQAIKDYANITFGNKRYTITDKVLGTGSFGVAMLCHEKGYSTPCVVKIVNLASKKHKNPQKILAKEVAIYQTLAQHKSLLPYLVRQYVFTKFEDRQGHLCHALVMDYAGKDLDKVLEAKQEYAMSPYQLFEIGLELIPAFRALHRCHIVHRDVKPENIVWLYSKRRSIFCVKLIDYGLATTWDPDHQPKRQSKGAGTPRFCAWRQQLGYAASPARDLEALIYSLVYLSGKKLPWHGLNISDAKRKARTIAYTKRDADPNLLCATLDANAQTNQTNQLTLASLLEETRALKYQDLPSYDKFEAYFKDSLARIQELESLSSYSTNSITSSPCPKPPSQKCTPSSQPVKHTPQLKPVKRKLAPHPLCSHHSNQAKKRSGS